MSFPSKAVDAVPEALIPEFLNHARRLNVYWYDMFLLCATFGLRNIECRELKVSQIDFVHQRILLTETKSERARLTRKVNKMLDHEWLTKGRRWVRTRLNDPNASLIVRLASSTKELALLAEEFGFYQEYSKVKAQYEQKRRPILREQNQQQLPCSRVIDFSSFKNIQAILKRRASKGNDYLFPSEEVAGRKGGDKPISRQSVYNVIQKLRHSLIAKLKGVRLGLHSCRKFAIQQVVKLTKDIFAASVWVGHGNGRGSTAMTERYLNRSEQRYERINLKLSKSLTKLSL